MVLMLVRLVVGGDDDGIDDVGFGAEGVGDVGDDSLVVMLLVVSVMLVADNNDVSVYSVGVADMRDDAVGHDGIYVDAGC